MTDDELRAVFEELNRIGADLSQPPGLAIGTGFRSRADFLGWLRALPGAIGHEEFALRLSDHVEAAEPNVGASLPRLAAGGPHRLWPTVEQMHAGIAILLEEWDPLGARLGELSRDDVTHHAYNAIGIVLGRTDPDHIERGISANLAGVEQEVFGVRPSPRYVRRYLARRFIRVVAENPGPAQEENAWVELARAARDSVEIARAAVLPALDAHAACTECGTIGTIAVVGREVEPFVLRFCPSCWLKAREQDLGGVPRRFAPPEEETTPEGIVAAFDAMGAELPVERDRFLRQMAADLTAQASTMYGPMPPQIEAFVRRYATPPDA
jgi:hypothetical protein